MTAMTDFDRLLSATLEADGPQGVPPGLVDAALAEAHAIRQRRPLVPVADRLGWPPIGLPIPRAASRRFVLIALVALLGVAVVASALLVAGGGPRPLVGDDERIYVWANSQAHLVTPDGVSSHSMPFFRGDAADCATLVPGTMTVTRGGFGQWHVIDLTTGQAVGSVSTDYGGGERWAPVGATLAQFDVTGRVGITTFGDPTRPITRWIPIAGVVDVAWSLDGERLAVLTIQDRAIGVVVIEAATEALTTVTTTLRSEFATIGWNSNGDRTDIRIGTEVDGSFTTTSNLVDTRTGSSTTMPELPTRVGQDGLPEQGALSPDGLRFAAPGVTSIDVFGLDGVVHWTIPTTSPARDLAWSSDGRRLAFRDGDRLVVADMDDGTHIAMALAATEPFRWDQASDDLIVARHTQAGALVERYRGRDLELLASQDVPGPTGTPTPPGAASTLCLRLDDAAPSS